MESPRAEIETSAELVEALVREQHPELAGPVRLVAHGWDSDNYRLGASDAVRLPRWVPAVLSGSDDAPEIAAIGGHAVAQLGNTVT